MEETASSQNKPLRRAGNKVKDLYNTYIKNESDKPHGFNQEPEELNIKIEENGNMSDKEEIKIENSESEINNENELATKLAEAEKERDELRDQIKRIAAELDNFRRRTLKEKQEMIDFANERLMFSFLSILDDFGAAIDAGRQKADFDSLMTGLEMIHQKAQKLFENEGVQRMEDPVGKPFDVNFQEAMMHIPSEQPEGYVVQEVVPGYMLRSKVLRHAKVITSAGSGEE